MWQWTLNWNEIRTDIVLGSCPMTGADIQRIKEEAGATAVLSLQTDDCRTAFDIAYDTLADDARALGIPMVNVPMLDFNPPDQRRNLPYAVRALTRLLAGEHRVYVHCTAGINRAPLTVLGYLTFVEFVAPDEALAFICQSRPGADPSWEAYNGCREDLVDYLRPFIHVRAYYVAEQHPDADATKNWYRAEHDVIRRMFTSPRSLPRPRMDPHRS